MSSSFGIRASGVDTMNMAGQLYSAICCADGVDIVNCDEKRHVQSLRDCAGALHAVWSMRTLHLAVFLKDSAFIYSCRTSPAALTPMWVKTKSIFFSVVEDINELVSSASFRYPLMLMLQGGEVRLINCRSGSNVKVEAPLETASMAQLSYTGLVVAICSTGSRRIDFIEVKGSSSLLISKKDHSNEVSFLSWRPGYASERELLLASDVSNLVRIFAVDHRHSFDGAEGRTGYAEAQLLIELGDFVGKPAVFSWLLHGMSTAAETSFLHDHFAKSDKEPVKVWKLGSSSTDWGHSPQATGGPSAIFSTANHTSTSGSWLTVLDDRGVLRLLCISPVGVTGHMQCILRGRGPVLKEMPDSLPVCGMYVSGRFQPNGAEKPVAIECVYVFRLNSSDNNAIGTNIIPSGHGGRVAGSYAFGGASETASNFERSDHSQSGPRRGSAARRHSGTTTSSQEAANALVQSRRLIRMVSVFTTGPADDFISVAQNDKEFIVADYHPNRPVVEAASLEVAGDLRKRIANSLLPASAQSGWRLETWETYSLGGNSGGGSVMPKSYRALSSPWVGTEAALWCYAHRHKNRSLHAEVVGSLASLNFQPIDVTAAGMGFELTHDILRALWLAAPEQAPPSIEEVDTVSSAHGHRKNGDHDNPTIHGKKEAATGTSQKAGSSYTANVPILVTLQQKQLGNYVVAIWAVQQSAAGAAEPEATSGDTGPVFGGEIGEIGGIPMADGSFKMGLKRNESKHKYNAEGPSLSVGIAGGVDFYEVSISPDPHFGLGLRLDVADGVVVVESFKRNPLTMKMMPAEESGIIGVGDELLSVNSNELKGHSLSDVIQIIRIVVQNARGSSVVLKLRGKNKIKSGRYNDDVISDDAADRLRMVSTAMHVSQPGWYHRKSESIDEEEPTGGFYDPNSTGRFVPDETPIVDANMKKSWQLELSHSFDDCVAVDVVLGGYGETLSRGDLWTASSGDTLAICVALRRVHGVEGSELELSVYEIAYDLSAQSVHTKHPRRRHSAHSAQMNADQNEREGGAACRYKIVHVGTIPWLGPTPYTLQVWRTGPLSYFVSTSTNGGVMTMCTIECLRTWDVHRKEAWSISAEQEAEAEIERPKSLQPPGRPHRSVSYTYASLDHSHWAIGQSFCMKLSVDALRLSEAHSKSSKEQRQTEFRQRSRSTEHVPEVVASASAVELAQWIPICCPFLDGRRIVVFGNPGGSTIMLAVMRTSNGDPIGPHKDITEPAHVAGVPLSRRATVINAIKTASVLECVQVINVAGNVRWVQWLEGYTFQVSTGSSWMVYARSVHPHGAVREPSLAPASADPNEIDVANSVLCSNHVTDFWHWTERTSAPFGCTDRPNTLSSSSVEQPSSILCGAVLATPNSDKRGLLPQNVPDWHPMPIAFKLFEHPYYNEFGDPVSDLKGFRSALRRIAALSQTSSAEITTCFDTIVSALNSDDYPELFSLESSVGLHLEVPRCTIETVQMLALSLSSTAKGIALAHGRKQGPSKLGNLAMNMLPIPFRTMSPVDILMMSAEALAVSEVMMEGQEKLQPDGTGIVVGTNGIDAVKQKPLSAEALISARFEGMDFWARNAVMINKCMCALDSLRSKPQGLALGSERKSSIAAEDAPVESKQVSDATNYTSDQSVRVSAAFVANAMVSSSQNTLYKEFIGDCAIKLCDQSLENPDIKARSKLHFGMLWWARNSAGQEATDGEYDILKSLTAIMAPLWLHDFTPLLSLIETVATQQFKYHRDSMKVFLEMVLVGKTEKLMLLAKTDKNVMGKQLKSLLSIDFASEKGRTSLHKNAFALLRLQRYKHAAAVFLCAEPPMLREAVRVVVKHLNDPFLALLITRIVEHRRATTVTVPSQGTDESTNTIFMGHSNGYVLGPVSRQLLETEIVPGLFAAAKQRKTDQLPPVMVTKSWGVWGSDACVLLAVVAQWLQDVSIFSKLAHLGRSFGYFTPSTDCSSVGKAKQLLTVASSWQWLLLKSKQYGRPEDMSDVVFELDALFDQAGAKDLRLGCRKLIDEGRQMKTDSQLRAVASSAFVTFSEQCLRDWSLNRAKRIAALKAVKMSILEVKNKEAQHQMQATTFTSSEAGDDEFDQALSKLNKMKVSNKVDNSIAVDAFSTAPKKGFNLATMASSSGSTQAAPSMLDAFDIPPHRPKPAAPPSMLDMFDAPPPPSRAKPATDVPNMLDMFDAPPPQARPKPQPPSALDMFDMAPPQKKVVAAPSSMLDMYDSPPPKPKPKIIDPPSALDMFDAAQPPRAKTAAPASMLDMYDPPPAPSPTKEANVVEMISSPAITHIAANVDEDEEVSAIAREEQATSLKIFHNASRATNVSDTPVSDITGSNVSACCDTVVHFATEHLFEARCIAELIKVVGCPTMGHPWAASGNIRGLIDIALLSCTKGRGDEKIRLMAFRCCLNELASKYAPILMTDVRVAQNMMKRQHIGSDGIKSKPVLRYILCARLLEYMELQKSLDCAAVRVLLCYAAGRAEEARRLLLSCAVAVFEASPQCADFADLCDAPVLRQARQSFMLCMAANLELVLTMNVSPLSSDLFIPACRMSAGLIAVVSIAIRTALMFGCVDHRYDILLKLLKHPPKFRLNTETVTVPVSSSKASTITSSTEAPAQDLKHQPSGRIRDQGYHYLKRVSRAEAIALLQGHPPGTFLIRPHDTQSEVLFLSFLSSAEEGVKHAIIRREQYSPGSASDEGILEEPDTGRRHHMYRCGKIGPCKTLEETLRNISLILPCRLLFSDVVVSIVVGEGLIGATDHASKVDREGSTHHHSRHNKLTHHKDGGFVSRVDRSFHDVKHTPAMSLLDISWNPNAEFWWEGVHSNKDDKSAAERDRSANPEESRQNMVAALHAGYLAPNQIDDFAGSEVETHIAERYREEPVQNIIISRDDPRDEDSITVEEPSGSQTVVKHESHITVALNRREQRRSNEDRGWGSPMKHENIGGMIRGVIQLLTVKTLYKQISGQMELIRKALAFNHADKLVDADLRSLIHLKLSNRLPATMLPKDGPEIAPTPSLDSSEHSNSHAAFGMDASKHSTMHSADGLPLSSIDYLLFPLALFCCVSERAMMSVLCPPLPLDPKTLTSPQLLAGEQLAQSMLSGEGGVPMNIAKIPHSALGSHLGFVVAHTSNYVSHSAPSIQDQVVECFELADGVKWMARHSESDALNTVLCYISSANGANNLDIVPDGSSTIKWLWKKGFLQNIVIGSGSSSGQSNSQIFYRYVDPWEVSQVTDQTAVLASCRLGRLWLGPVSAHGASGLVEVVSNYLKEAHDREATMLQLGAGSFNANALTAGSEDSGECVGSSMNRHLGDKGFLRLWETLRAEAWLVMCISSATDQPERETGGPDAFVEANVTGLSAQDPYHLCISRYLYRNALFKRVYLPHRFVAMIQVDTFVLKDLAPHKFKAGVVSAPIEVYGVLRLIRSGGGGGVKKTDALKKGSCDIVVTSSRRAETAKSASTSQPSEYLWREQAVLRFPLPESILSVDPFCDDESRYLRQPPRKLQLSVYETRSIFGDQKLGDLELPLSALTDDRPFREWLPLTSEKGSAWFIRIQLQLRFLLMAHDADRASDPESSTIRSQKGKVTGERRETSRSSLMGRPSHLAVDSKMSMSHRGSMSSKEDVPIQSSPLDRFRATASVMYESALTEAAALGHAGVAESPSSGIIDGKPTSPAPRQQGSNGRPSALEELGDFF